MELSLFVMVTSLAETSWCAVLKAGIFSIDHQVSGNRMIVYLAPNKVIILCMAGICHGLMDHV